MAILSIENSTQNEGSIDHDFLVSDKNGRRVGTRIWQRTVEFDPAPADAISGWGLEPGTYYAWRAWAMRGGDCFGACQTEHFCKSKEERTKAIEKYLNAAKARAIKNHG